MDKTYVEIVHSPPIPAEHKRVRAAKDVTKQIKRLFAELFLAEVSGNGIGKCSVNWYIVGAEVRIYHDTPGQSISYWAIRYVDSDGKLIF